MSETSAQAPVDDIIHETKITPVQWAIMALCFIAYVLDGFDIVVIAFTAPAISADWGIPSQQLGLVFSAGVLGMTLGAMFLSSLADIFGRRAVVSLMLILAGVATCGVSLTQTVPQLMLLRLIAGLGLGALVATLAPLTGEYSPRRYRTLILAIMFSSASLGPVIGGLISAPLITRYGWQSIFLYAGLITIVVGILLYAVVPESIAYIIKRKPDGALEKVNRILRYIGQQPISQLPPVRGDEVHESASVVSLLTASRRSMTLMIWTTFFLGFASVYFLTSWVPQILTNVGFPQDKAILGAVVIASGSIIGTTLFGWLARWWPLNRIIALVFVIGGLGIAALSFMFRDIGAMPIALVWMTLFLVGVTLMGGFSNLYTVALTMYPAQVRSTGIGWAAGLGRCGAVLSPAVAGLLIAAGVSMPALFLYFAIPTLLAAGCVLVVRMQELS